MLQFKEYRKGDGHCVDCNRALTELYVFEKDDGSEHITGMECFKKHWREQSLMQGWKFDEEKQTGVRWVFIEGQPFRLVVAVAKEGGHIGKVVEGIFPDGAITEWCKPRETREEAMQYCVDKFLQYCFKHGVEWQ